MRLYSLVGFAALTLLASSLSVAQTPEFLYVANNGSNSVSAYAIDATTGALTPVPGSPFAAGIGANGVAVDPKGKYLYVTNGNSNDVSAYAINPASGSLTLVVGSPFSAGNDPRDTTVDPFGRFLYVADYVSSNVYAYMIDRSTGALTPVAGSPFAGGTVGVAVDPSGHFLYASNGGYANKVFAYSIDGTSGGLTSVPGSPFVSGGNPFGLAAHPSGRFLYEADNGSNTVSAYTLDATSGALTPVAGSPFAAGGNCGYEVAVDPSGKFVYATNDCSGSVSGFSVDATSGALTAVLGSPVGTGSSPVGVAVDPSGRFVYIANNGSNNISAFAIDVATGALTPVSGSPFATGSAPSDIAVIAEPLPCAGSSTIASNFNGTPISAGDYVWFTSNFRVTNGLGSTPVTVQFTDGTIQFTANNQNYHVSVPNSTITFASSNSCSNAAVSGGAWQVTVPMSGSDEVFLSGLAFPVGSGGLPGGIKNVTWSGTFNTNEPGLTMQWKWGAAVYSQFPDAASPVIKPTHTAACAYPNNSDHAGTPENDKSFVVGGATGGGGSNWTGSWSGTASAPFTCQQ